MDGAVKKIKKILVATDFSQTSDFAISRAVTLARENNARLTLIHVIEKGFFDKTLEAIIPEEILQTPEEYAAALMQEKINSLIRNKSSVDYVIISKGKPAAEILKYTRKKKIDLLVMGAHGKYTIRDSFVGTTAEYVSERTRCPVLIIKNIPRKPFRKILVPIDFTNTSKSVLNYTLRLFPDANIHFIHVGDYEYENLLKKGEKEDLISKSKIIKMRKAIILYLDNKMKRLINEYAKKLGKAHYNITLGYPGPVIINEANKENSDLIVMGTQGHGRKHYLFMGSVANRVLSETGKDILLVPPKIKS